MRNQITVAALLACLMGLTTSQQLIAQQQRTAQRKSVSTLPDDLRVSVQKICPVSGLELGAHGPPIKVKVGNQVVFLCCDACKSGKIKKEHWAAIHQNFARAQGECPVMENALPKGAESVVVDGQVIYVCCPPCIEKINAAPQKYLAKLAESYTNSLKAPAEDGGVSAKAPAKTSAKVSAKTSAAAAAANVNHATGTGQSIEQVQAALQGICPVSGLKLGAHGPPVKAKIGKLELFLCCEGCKGGKVKPEHWAQINRNFARAQGSCMVMGNPLPESPKWTIVDGQIIYVCCPPCIEKIAAAPKEFLKQLAGIQAAYVKSHAVKQ